MGPTGGSDKDKEKEKDTKEDEKGKSLDTGSAAALSSAVAAARLGQLPDDKSKSLDAGTAQALSAAIKELKEAKEKEGKSLGKSPSGLTWEELMGSEERRGGKMVSYLKSQKVTHSRIVVGCQTLKQLRVRRIRKNMLGHTHAHQRLLDYVVVLKATPNKVGPNGTMPTRLRNIEQAYRFPRRDHPHAEFPKNIGDFCFPDNADVERWCDCGKPKDRVKVGVDGAATDGYGFPLPSTPYASRVAPAGAAGPMPGHHPQTPQPRSSTPTPQPPLVHSQSQHCLHTSAPTPASGSAGTATKPHSTSATATAGFHGRERSPSSGSHAQGDVRWVLDDHREHDRLFNFMLTDASGRKVYAACLCVYEAVDEEDDEFGEEPSPASATTERRRTLPRRPSSARGQKPDDEKEKLDRRASLTREKARVALGGDVDAAARDADLERQRQREKDKDRESASEGGECDSGDESSNDSESDPEGTPSGIGPESAKEHADEGGQKPPMKESEAYEDSEEEQLQDAAEEELIVRKQDREKRERDITVRRENLKGKLSRRESSHDDLESLRERPSTPGDEGLVSRETLTSASSATLAAATRTRSLERKLGKRRSQRFHSLEQLHSHSRKSRQRKDKHKSRTSAYAVVLLCSLPLIQLLREALRSLPLRRDMNLKALIETPEFRHLVIFTRPTKVPIDVFDVRASPLQVPAHDFSFGLLFRCLQ